MLQKLSIINEKGLHARASAKFVETVERFNATALVGKDGISAEANSIMGLLMLAASYGTIIEVETFGTDASILAKALKKLVDSGFGEVSQ